MTSSACRVLCLACCGAILTLAAAPARADFFDDARKTFTTDIPHFFQDDIPCAFGGQPTSHTKASCNSSKPPARPAAEKDSGAVRERPQHAPPTALTPPDPPPAAPNQ